MAGLGQRAVNSAFDRVIGGAFDFLLSTDSNQYLVNRANKHLQEAGNVQSAAAANLATVNQSIANQNRVTAAGRVFNAMQGNLARNIDSMAASTAMGMLQISEQIGATTAAAAAAGVGGSSVEAYNETQRTVRAQRLAMTERDKKASVIGASGNLGAVMADAYGGMDRTFIAANIDVSDTGNQSGDQFGNLLAFGAAAAVSAAGAPQIGSAILEAKASGNWAQAGNNQAASASLSQALGSLNKSGGDWQRLSSFFKI